MNEVRGSTKVGWDQRLISRAGPPFCRFAHGGPALALLAGPTLRSRIDDEL